MTVRQSTVKAFYLCAAEFLRELFTLSSTQQPTQLSIHISPSPVAYDFSASVRTLTMKVPGDLQFQIRCDACVRASLLRQINRDALWLM